MNQIFILILTITTCMVCAEPPRYRQQRLQQFGRQESEQATTEQDESTDDAPYPQSASGPYAPSGWKPSGQLLVLPSQRRQQQQQYLPPQQYGTPTTTEYVTPDDDKFTTAEASDSSESNETTDEPDSENVNVEDGPPQVQANFNVQPQPQQQPGYFVQLADGSVQQVLYVATSNNAVGAKLQAQPVVQAQPFVVQPFYVPQAVSFSSQYQSW